jgi:acetyl-CoA C-acetyltransferase
VDAIKSGKFEKEIVPVVIPQKKSESLLFQVDERPRETTMEYLSGLKPVFKKDGSITAGNASGISDGAAALLLMSTDKAGQMGLKPLAKIKAWSSAALEPFLMGLGPVSAVRKLYKETGYSNKDIDVIEINEAFAAQVAGCMKELKWDYRNTNLHGSGISLGHPIGATGARMAVSLIYDMMDRDLNRGLQTMCIGGGMGMAAIWER